MCGLELERGRLVFAVARVCTRTETGVLDLCPQPKVRQRQALRRGRQLARGPSEELERDVAAGRFAK